MKSLNKTLSLVLALCLVFSLMGVAGAADFKDDAKIQYNEAVDVMNSIGVINGIGNDTFAPTASVTRAEAAKMVAYAVLGADVAKNLPAATTKFTDVDATAFSWATGSINYLTSKGIINGTSATTFEPNGKITAFQLGKMLLCAAGYGVNGEFVGPNWNINVSVTSNSTGIFKDTKAESFNAPATREEAALYCFNGITKVAKVSYSKLDGMYKAVKDITGDDDVLTLAEIAYPKLKSNSAKEDSFGRPAIVWTNKGNEIGKYAATAKFTYTKNLDSAAGKRAIAKDLKGCTFGKNKDVDIQLQPWENGKQVAKIDNDRIVGYISENSGNGTVVSVYTDEDDDKIITAITVIKEDLAKVTFVNTAKKSVRFETITNSDSAVEDEYEIDSDNPNYAAVKDLEEDDLVLITPVYSTLARKHGVAKVAMPKTETGFIGAVDTHNGKIYLGTTPYEIAAAKTDAVAKADVDTKNEATLWLDSFGFVVNTKATTAASTNFILALDTYSTIVDGKIVPMMEGVLTNGTTANVAIDAITNDVGTINSGDLFAVESTDDDIYVLAKPEKSTKGTSVKLKLNGDINSYDKKLTGEICDDHIDYYATDVKFVYVDTKTKKASVKTGVQKVTDIKQGSYAVIEKNAAKQDVVTAVYLINTIPTSVDSDSILFLPSREPIGSRAVMNTTTNKYEKFNVYGAYLDGALVEGGIIAKSVSTAGFNSFAKSDDTGAYVLASYTADEGKTAVKEAKDGIISSKYANKYVTFADKLELDISSAKICDVRAKDDQLNNPVTPTAKGICNAVDDNAAVALSVIYNKTTGEADVVYIAKVVTNKDAEAAAKDAAEKEVKAQLDNVEETYKVAYSAENIESAAKAKIEADVSNKVDVSVTAVDGKKDIYKVVLTSKTVDTVKGEKEITVNKEDPSKDASLKEIKVGTTALKDFNAEKLEYNVVLEKGTTEIPTVEATTKDANASKKITVATALADNVDTTEVEENVATIVVTAEDVTIQKTYKITFTVATEG